MKKLRNTILVASLMVMGLTIPIQAKRATMDEALTVANNWISLILQKKGAWADANTAYVEDIQEFKRGRRTLGYFCRVWPKGYIVLSLHKQLAPVKAYSATCDLDPESQEGMTDLIKNRMDRILGRIDERAKKLKQTPDQVMATILDINYRDAWNELQVDTMSFQQMLDSDIEPMNYQEGLVLLSSSWHQGDPYNRDCPAPRRKMTALQHTAWWGVWLQPVPRLCVIGTGRLMVSDFLMTTITIGLICPTGPREPRRPKRSTQSLSCLTRWE